jgi:hypothetical protein
MSRRRKLSPREQLHADWLGMLRPEGLVVSVPVLVEADAYVRQAPEIQAAVRGLAPGEQLPVRAAFDRLLTDVFGWPASRLAREDELGSLAVALPDLGVELRPDGALVDRGRKPLVFLGWTDGDLDEPAGETRWPVSRHQRFERLLLESQSGGGAGSSIGLHGSPGAIRLTYAPRGEAPGSLTFPIDALCAWDGRVLVDALLMLLGRDRLFTVPQDRRLQALLEASRKRQEQVTVALAGQVEEALGILVAGFDLAHKRTRGSLLAPLGHESAQELRDGLVSVLLRLVFLLYCEDGGVLPMEHPLYLDNYSIGKLVDSLEQDRVLYPEAMRHRYGAWARLCALFRLVHGGIRHGDLVLPPRQGELFHPDRHPWLEGRVSQHAAPGEPPPVDDGVVLDVLDRLVYLENQRLSYRNLDVEQIGSVYEALMALELRRCGSRTVPVRGGGWLELGDVLESTRPLPPVESATGLKKADLYRRAPALARFKVTGDHQRDEDTLVEALSPLLDGSRAERVGGQHILVGGAERNRTGSHYTPTSLTRPIVERTLGPVLGKAPSAERILDTKVCDPAVGSGAFLAEACRYLGQKLLDAWVREGGLPPAEKGDPLLLARRTVAERCLYGVDKNAFAVQLARLSLWLVTLAKDQPFTFVDHALRPGDAIVGLNSKQIAAFDFEPTGRQGDLFVSHIRRSIKDAMRDRAYITEPAPLYDWRDEYRWKEQYLRRALDEVDLARRRGNLLIGLAWDDSKGAPAKALFGRVRGSADNWFISAGDSLLLPEAQELLNILDEVGLSPFHWELEFPEVFARTNGGFDAIIGNPPFVTGRAIRGTLGEPYPRVLRSLRSHTHGNADIAAQFFLRTAEVLRKGGCFGLVATNTIKQGQTRATGLQYLLSEGEVEIYDGTTDYPWPVLGGAAVVVDVVHGCRGEAQVPRFIRIITDGVESSEQVEEINSLLAEGPELADPVVLKANAGRSFQGSIVLGKGFVLEPAEARSLVDADPKNAEVVRPYIGGEELNSNAPGAGGMVLFDRYVISFFKRSEREAAAYELPFRIVEERVKPERTRKKPDGSFKLRRPLPQRWWQFADKRPALYSAISRLERCLVTARVSKHHLFGFQPTDRVFSEALVVVAFDDWFSFAVLQSRVHEYWSRAAGLGSTLETRTRYTPSSIFETFPFPRLDDEARSRAADAGLALAVQRSLCMRRFGEGMTQVWNRLFDPDETDAEITKLRTLRDEMDRAVLAAYNWPEVDPEDTAEIVKRLRSLNAKRAAEQKRRTWRTPTPCT